METSSSTSDASPPDAPIEPSAAAPTRRHRGARVRPWLGDRMTPTTLFGLMAALAVFVLVIVLLQDRREMVTVAMTSERVPAGATITEAMVERAEVPASVRFSGDLVPFDEAVGATASRTLQPGEPVARSAVGARSEASGARVMAIPVESWQAAGGELDVGDRVDVIDTGDRGPRYVLSGAAVVGRATSERSGGLVASQSNADLWVSVEVTAAQALDLAAVIDGGDFVLVRSTGATDDASAAPSPPAATSADGSQAPSTSGSAPTASTVAAGGG
jgi:Flp pilus assembly protein CpaB